VNDIHRDSWEFRESPRDRVLVVFEEGHLGHRGVSQMEGREKINRSSDPKTITAITLFVASPVVTKSRLSTKL
jgi:hypothetical protein